MIPRTRPLLVGLRPGVRAQGDPLHSAWTHLTGAREVPFQAASPGRWVHGFNTSARAALDAFSRHCQEAAHPDSFLSVLSSHERFASAVKRQRDDHTKIARRLESIVQRTQSPDPNALGQVIRANEDAAMAQLYIGLHQGRLRELLREAGLLRRAVGRAGQLEEHASQL